MSGCLADWAAGSVQQPSASLYGFIVFYSIAGLSYALTFEARDRDHALTLFHGRFTADFDLIQIEKVRRV